MGYENYLDDAKKIYEGQYATKLADLERLKAQQLAEYDKSNAAYTKQYDDNIADNQKQGVQRVNNYNNNTLSRGMGRSTIATTGIAGIDNQTAALDNNLKAEKIAKLADITTQRNNYLDDYGRQVSAVNAEKQAAMNKYAIDMYNQEQEYARQQALAAARSYSSDGGSGGYSSASDVSNAIENDVASSVRSGDLDQLSASKSRVDAAYQQGYLSDSAYSKYIGNLNSSYDLNNRAQQKINQGTYGYSTAGAYNKPKNTSTSTSNKKTGTSAINYKYVNGQAVRV